MSTTLRKIARLVLLSALMMGMLVGCASPQLHALTGNTQAVEKYLDSKSADINNIDAAGNSMLHMAVSSQRLELTKLLLEKGANPNLVNKAGMTPILIAVTNNQELMVDLLLKHQLNLNQKNEKGATALSMAIAHSVVSKRNKETAKKLIAAGADVNVRDTDGRTALLLALQFEIDDIAELLIDGTADASLADYKKNAPLHFTAWKENLALTKKLIGKKADLNARDINNATPLIFSAMRSRTDIAQTLVAAGANLNLTADSGGTALSFAAKDGNTALVSYLLKAGADPNLGYQGNKPLELARKFNRSETIAVLEKALGIKPSPTEPPAATAPKGQAFESLKLSATGSGMRVSAQGSIVTNAHVIEGCRDIRVNNLSTPVLATDAVNDLAIIKGTPGQSITIRNGDSVKVGESVVVVGFPLSGLLGSGIQANTGDVSALSGISNDSRVFQISAPVNPGNSGGPLFDNRGNLIGVVKSKLSASRMLKTTGDLPQNINFAIKSNVLTAFLKVHGVSYKSTPSDKVRSVVDIVESARETTFSIECWN